MTWIDDNKGAGIWPFTPQPDKPFYNEGNLISDHDNPVWKTDFLNTPVNSDDRITPVHHPWCGYWTKDYVPPSFPSVEWGAEIYYELLKSEVAIPHIQFAANGQYVVHMPSVIKLDVEDFDGDLTWEFEAIWCNRSGNPARLQVVDAAYNIYADLPMTAGLSGYTDWNLFRTRVTFTPGSGSISYRLRFDNQGNVFYQMNPNDAMVITARIVLTQTNATKTKLQIPMFSSPYNYALQYYNEINCWGSGFEVYDNHSGAYGDDWSDYRGDSRYIASEIGSTIWKYDKSELNNVSKVVFDVDAEGGKSSTVSDKTQYIMASLDILYFDLMLYWAPAGSPTAGCATATPGYWVSETQVHTDTCTGTVFTPIPGSHICWDGNNYPYNLSSEPDFSSVPHDALIFTGGDLRIYHKDTPEPWQHFASWYSNPAGTTTSSHDEVFTIVSQTLNQFKSTFASCLIESTQDLTVALLNITTGLIVAGSQLTWTYDEKACRKSVEISGGLTDNCEYKIVAKAPGFDSVSHVYKPDFYDAQLLLTIDLISKLTIWQRVTHCYDDYWDNWTIPAGWNASSIGSRARLLSPEGLEIYFEQTGVYAYELGRDSYIALEDMGSNDATGSGIGGSEVGGSALIWTSAEEGVALRKRTGLLNLTADHIYDNRQPDGDGKDLYLGTGFLVLKVV